MLKCWLAASLLAAACHSAGPYGYSRSYTPLDAEEQAAKSAREFDPVMSRRVPEEWKQSTLSVFGVVKARGEAPGGRAYLTLSMRTLAERNLCDTADQSTCRVTVGEREHAVVHVMVQLTGTDDLGKHSVAPGSLVRVIGQLTDEVGADGAAVLSAQYLRHWPRGEYVTMSDSAHMRR